jgi:hypothetical protein
LREKGGEEMDFQGYGLLEKIKGMNYEELIFSLPHTLNILATLVVWNM